MNDELRTAADNILYAVMGGHIKATTEDGQACIEKLRKAVYVDQTPKGSDE